MLYSAIVLFTRLSRTALLPNEDESDYPFAIVHTEQNYLSVTYETTSFRLLGYRVTLKLSKYSPTRSTASKRPRQKKRLFQDYPGQGLKLRTQVNKECNMTTSNCHQA